MTRPLHTIADWRRAYDEGAEPLPLYGALLARLSAQDPAWITRASCAVIEAQLAALPPRSAALPLWGVPFAVKDNIDVAGLPTTAACPAFAHEPATSATCVQRLQQAGAVCIGKTNLDQFATGLVGTRSPYGAVPNSFDPAFVSGGSSSGSASVVARGLVPFALGTDTAGSGRVPAGFNHLVGLKPSPGRVPMAGVLPACRTLDVVSVFALTVADAAEVMAWIEGADDEPRFAWPALQPPWLGGAHPALRLGVPDRPGCDSALGWDRAFDDALARARSLGAETVPLDFGPLFEVAELLYDGPWVAERHSVVADLMARQPEALDPTVAAVIGAATRYSADDAFLGRYRLEELRARLAPLWQQVDALLVPTAPTCPTLAAVAAEPVRRNSELGRYTNFVNLLGWSALALPAVLPEEGGLPFGITLIGPGGADAALIDWGLRWEAAGPDQLGARLRAARADDRTPGRRPQAAPTLALAVVGAHLQGLPLHGQLVERGARLLARTTTAARYRLHALPGSTPPKPGLARVADGQPGHAIALEVYELPQAALGSFLALIPPPLGLGNVELADGRWVKGFICEGAALQGAPDISAFGGWRAYLARGR
ncbi:allophanate hydrolase [Ideonella sp. 4Y11]|uniref:Allophanate hydrolase n=1 Tax=Ideonella aquatica TaxID=2824119 RepID=A0A940YGV6_9BURK|nr:allophanate hydrolase [Ideonella aquatica]MBQ0959885.1 allophanate hydrolase [Ideonella aquatica]